MKVCVVGLDGATWDLLDPWLDDLPTISEFAASFRADLRSCVPPLSIPAWKVYSTGMNPGQLGVFTFVGPDFEERRFNTVTNRSFVHRELWDYLGDDGRRSAVINMPTTHPPREIDGWMISGPFSGKQSEYTHPAGLEETLEERGYTILPEYYLSRDPADIDSVIDSIRTKLDVGLSFQHEADFIHVTLFQTDTVQHTEWDSVHAKAMWEEVDAALGAFVEELGDEWNVILMSDHGFGKSKGIFYLNPWLEQKGWMNFDRSGVDFGDVAAWLGLDYASAKRLIRRLNLVGPTRKVVPSSLLRKIARQMPGNRKLEGLENLIDWDSEAIALAPLIYTETQSLAEEIQGELLELRGKDDERVVDEVFFGEELYPDAEVRVPDLIIKHGDHVISDVDNDEILLYDSDQWPEHKVAHHRMEGILAAKGPDVSAARAAEITAPNLTDLAPTILDGFGVDIPTEMTGERLGLLGSRGRRRAVETRLGTERVVEHDSDVERRLEDLGYI